MRVRKMDTSGDYVFGGSQAAFYKDQPEAVAQICWTRMRLWLGQWYLNTADGTPWNTEILGKYTENKRDPALRKRILTAPGVTGITSYSSSLNRNSRAWSVAGTIETAYGIATFQGPL